MVRLFITLMVFLLSNGVFALNSIQKKPTVISKELVGLLKKVNPDSSNANSVITLLGEPSACMPVGPGLSENWMCQWKGNLTSCSIVNTINITFEAGMIVSIVVLDKKGKLITHK